MITARLPPKYIVALTAVARPRKKPRSRILFDAIERYLKDMYYNRAGGVIHLQDLIRDVRLRVLSNAVKAWLIAYHECVAVAAGLPGRRV